MAALKGLSGITQPDPVGSSQYMDEGVLEARASPMTPDPEHSEFGSQSFGYQGITPWENPYGPFPSYDGWTYNPDYTELDYRAPGMAIDQTPESHIAPWPRGIQQPSYDNPDAYAYVGEQVRELHGKELGGTVLNVLNSITGREEVTNYTTDDYVAPNENYLSPEVPGQLKPGSGHGGGFAGTGNAGGSNADPTQGYGVLNTMPEFNAGHSIRRVQHDHMPWDYTNLHGEQDVPFPARHPVQQMPLDGPDSPFFEMGDISKAQVVWEGRIGDPTPYVQPAEVTIAPALPDEPDVFAWGGAF